jgi:GMP synthase (glutamine-hydrolysing)
VVIVQHEPSVPPGSLLEVLTAASIEHSVFEAWRRTDWPPARELGALVVLGGTMNVEQTDLHPFLEPSLRLMSDAVAQAVPTLGVCLGAQMLAFTLGEKVFRAEPRNALFGPLEPTLEGVMDPVLEPFASGIEVLQFHEDTFAVPSGSVPLARSVSSKLMQAFRHGETAYAVQFHFEVDKEILRGWCHDIGPADLRAGWGVDESELMLQADRYIADQRTAGKLLFERFLGVAGLTSL